jgi:hypothetical protein
MNNKGFAVLGIFALVLLGEALLLTVMHKRLMAKADKDVLAYPAVSVNR